MTYKSRLELFRNVAYSSVGLGAPLLAAVVATPRLVAALGLQRFGVLTLVWAVMGYASIFDFGIGRAMTHLLAERRGKQGDDANEVFWTGFALMLALGVLAGTGLALGAPLLVDRVVRAQDLRSETGAAFRLLGMGIPLVVTSTALRGALEAHQKFGIASAVRVYLGVATFVVPLAVLIRSPALPHIVEWLIVARLLGWIFFLMGCLRAVPDLRRLVVRRERIGQLLRAGGWMTVSNIISPLMVNLDRFVIGTLLSATAVAYYSAPFEIVAKLAIIPAALTTVLFPTFSAEFARNPSRAAQLHDRGLHVLTLTLLPFSLAVVLFGPDALALWLGADFAARSAPVAQVLGVAFAINGVAGVPYALIQGAGRADVTAKLHLVELPIYLILLAVLLRIDGVRGAAFAWLIRVTIDAAMLFMARRRLLGEKFGARDGAVLLVGPICGLLAGPVARLPLALRGVALAIAIGAVTVGMLRAFRSRRTSAPVAAPSGVG